MFTAEGRFIGSKEVPYWHTWIKLPVAILVTIATLITLGITIATNNLSTNSTKPSATITNDLPF